MKSTVVKLLIIGAVCLLSSCYSDDDIPRGGQAPNSGIKAPFEEASLPFELQTALEWETSNHQIRINTIGGDLYNGYNDLYIQFESKANHTPIYPTTVEIGSLTATENIGDEQEPISHSCPYSSFDLLDEVGFRGYIIFNSSSDSSTEWELQLKYQIDGTSYAASKTITVDTPPARNHLKSLRFKGEDNQYYTLALISPEEHHNGLNYDIYAGLYREGNQGNYLPAAGYTLHVDPRMPGVDMKNHSTPFDDFEEEENGFYKAGSISYSMTGYWELNFTIQNPEGQFIAGEVISDLPPEGEGVTEEDKEAFYDEVSSVHFRIDIFN